MQSDIAEGNMLLMTINYITEKKKEEYNITQYTIKGSV